MQGQPGLRKWSAAFTVDVPPEHVSWVAHASSQLYLLLKDHEASCSHLFWPHLCEVGSILWMQSSALPLAGRGSEDPLRASSQAGVFYTKHPLSLGFSPKLKGKVFSPRSLCFAERLI